MTTTKAILPIIIALAVISAVGIAEAKTVKISEAYTNGIWVYGNERLYIVNDDNLPHSIRSVDNLFDTSILWPNQLTDFEKLPVGDYEFYDQTNKSRNGTLYVRAENAALPRITVDRPTMTAGNIITITGTDFDPSKKAHLQVLMPDGSVFEDLSLTPTSEGTVNSPFQTQRSDPNGVYTVRDASAPQNYAYFVVTGGVAPAAPIEEFEQPILPAYNVTQAGIDLANSQNQTVPAPVPVQTPQNTANAIQASTLKQALLNWLDAKIVELQNQLDYYTQIRAMIASN